MRMKHAGFVAVIMLCAAVSSAQVTASIIAQTNVACNGASTGSLTVAQSGGTPNFDYAWSNGSSTSNTASSTNTITSLAAGTYTVTVTDSLANTATASATITQPTALTSFITSQTNVACNGGSTGSVTVTRTGGVANFNYSWSNGSSTTNTSASTNTISSLAAGTYTVTVTDANGCTTTTSTSITQPPALAVSLTSQTNVACNGGSTGSASVVTTGGAAGYTYSWTGGGTGATKSALAAGTYTVTVTDANSCTATTSVTITQPTALVVSATIDASVSCNGGSEGGMTASPSGGTPGYTYSWSNAATTASITGVAAGTYTVTVTDANGCTASASDTVTEPTVLSASATVDANVACNGGSDAGMTVSPTGGTGGYSYSWSNSATTATLTGIAAGTYTVTVTDAKGCTATASNTVIEPAAFSVMATLDFNASCNGGSDGQVAAFPTGGTAGYTYLWSNSATTATVVGLAAGTYTVTVTDANGCTATSSATVTEPAAIGISTALTNVSCNGASDGALSATPSGGAPGYTYLWSNSATTAAITGLAAGTYTVTVTDSGGCTATSSNTVTEPTALSTLASVSSNVSCNGGSDGLLTATPSGGTAAYTYQWSNGATTASTTGLAAGTYTVTVTDANGCTASASNTVTQPSTLSTSISAQTNVACNGASTGSLTVSPSGGTAAYTYLWSNGTTSAAATGLAAGAYTVTVTDANGCTATAASTVTEPTAFSASAAVDSNASCNGSTDGQLTATPSGGTAAYTYLWSNAATTATITGVAAGTYTVTVTDANGCTTTASNAVTEPSAISPTATVDANVSCNGGSNGQLTASQSGGTPGYTYLWSNAATTATITGVTAGTYTVTVTDAGGCTASASGTVTEPAVLSTSASVDSGVTCNGGTSGQMSASPSGGTAGYTYLWSNGATTSVIASLAAGTYTVTVTDANGCTATASNTMSEPTAVTTSASSQTNVSCAGASNGAASVTAATGGAGGYTYDWSPGNPTGDGTTSVSGLTVGTWVCTVTDASGCTATQSFTITEAAGLSATAVSTGVSCNGESDGSGTISVSGGTGPFSYAWAPAGGTGATSTGLPAGNYTVTVTDANACTTVVAVAIDQPAALGVSATGTDATSPVACDGTATVFITGGTAPHGVLWLPGGATSGTITNLCPGDYVATVVDGNGCTTEASVTIGEGLGVAPDPEIVVVDGCIQFGGPCTLAAVSRSGVSQDGWEYVWTMNGFIGNEPTIQPVFPAPGTWVIELQVVNNGLSGMDSVTLVIGQPCPAGQLCLLTGRFGLSVSATDQRTGNQTDGTPKVRNDVYGFYSFPEFTGNADNPEVFVKMLDGRPVNGHYWVFFGGLTDLEYTITVVDKETSETKTYTKPAGSSSGGFDVGGGYTIEDCPGEVDGEMSTTTPGTCVEDSGQLCLTSGRFRVRLSARDHRTGTVADGLAIAQADVFGHFALPGLTGDPLNPEVFVKVLDGRAINGKFWVFYTGLTDLEYTLEVTDTETGTVRTYTKESASACGAFDTNAF